MSPTPLRISAVVPARNCPDTLTECLDALRDALGSSDELLVVDDASTDTTAAAARAHGATVVSLARRSGPAAARNAGAAGARGDLLLFVDADVVVHPDAVARLRAWFEAPEGPAAVFGSYDAAPRAPGLVSRYRNLLHHFTHQHGGREASTFWAGLGAVRRSAFADAGGFDAQRYPEPSIEDIELGCRLRQSGARILLDPSVQGTHLKTWTLSSVLRTDIGARGLPWSRLILETGTSSNDLNVSRSQRWSVALLGTSALLFPASLWKGEALLLSLALLAAVLFLNRRLYKFFAASGGPGFGLGCLPLHLLYLAYSGACYLYAWLERGLGGGWRPARLSPSEGGS